MEELWGMKSILDNADDVALFIVGERDKTVLYCNHFVTLQTGAHAGSQFCDIWDPLDYKQAIKNCEESSTYRYVAEKTPVGSNKNVTVGKVVWTKGIRAYSFLITVHVDDKEEKEREKIFSLLGQSYLNMYLLDTKKWEISMLKESQTKEMQINKPISYDEWKKNFLSDFAHPDDLTITMEHFENGRIKSELKRNNGIYAFQLRRRFGEEYRWTEFQFRKIDAIEQPEKVVCTERDIQGELTLNRKSMENEVIMKSISNVYRSVYLLDLVTGEYETVKPDMLLFGIPKEGVYDELMQIVSELIPDGKQKKDYQEYFSIPALAAAFQTGIENVGREYNSILSSSVNWMSVQVFRPPYLQGMEQKCILTFMDITEHKRVEAERNESGIVIDVLSSRYMAVFFVNLKDGCFHSIKVQQKYRYIEKQFNDITTAMKHYAMVYVLEQYRDIFQEQSMLNKIPEEIEESGAKQEYIYRNIDNQWVRLNIFLMPELIKRDEVIIAFEDYDDIMEQHALSVLYNTTMLANYDGMYEYDPENNLFFTLTYDGEKLVREQKGKEGVQSLQFYAENVIHPDDLQIFMAACSMQNVEECIREGKTVSHLYLRRKFGEEYQQYMYGFHFFEEFGKKRVLIMARDADKEIV